MIALGKGKDLPSRVGLGYEQCIAQRLLALLPQVLPLGLPLPRPARWRHRPRRFPCGLQATKNMKMTGYKLLRGGSWDEFPWYCRSAHRIHGRPSLAYGYVGFRVVCLPQIAQQSKMAEIYNTASSGIKVMTINLMVCREEEVIAVIKLDDSCVEISQPGNRNLLVSIEELEAILKASKMLVNQEVQ